MASPPLNPQKVSVKAGKLLLHEIDGCLESGESFGLESTLSGTTHIKILQRAKTIGYLIELDYLWILSPVLAIQRIRQRVKKGGHSIPDNDVHQKQNRTDGHLRRSARSGRRQIATATADPIPAAERSSPATGLSA